MTDVNDLINSLNADDVNGANAVFASVMQDKINASLDDRKIGLAQQMAGVEAAPEPEEEVLNDEDFEADDEVQGVQDDDEPAE